MLTLLFHEKMYKMFFRDIICKNPSMLLLVIPCHVRCLFQLTNAKYQMIFLKPFEKAIHVVYKLQTKTVDVDSIKQHCLKNI